MAASVIITVPLVLMVLVFQKKIVEGLTSGAIKG
jgi:ABC-type maltose transport system permease subunit